MFNIKKIKPLGSTVITTARKWAVDELSNEGLIMDTSKMAGALKEYQTVVSVGSYVKDIKPGDLVCINPANYAVRKFSQNSIKNDLMENDTVRYNFNIVGLDGIPHLMITDRDIMYIIEEYSEETESAIIQPNSDIILS